MSEGEVVEQLVQQANLLLVGVGVFFTILSVYLAGLNYVLSEESVLTRTIAFAFVTLCLVMLFSTMLGAQVQHAGLVERLRELDAEGALTAAGRAALSNAENGLRYAAGHILTIDEVVVYLAWGAGALFYLALIHLTFFYKWRPPADSRGQL